MNSVLCDMVILIGDGKMVWIRLVLFVVIGLGMDYIVCGLFCVIFWLG